MNERALTMLQLLHCNIGHQGWCELHATDHNYGAWLGPPIEPAPILSVHNLSTTFHQAVASPMVIHDDGPPSLKRVLLRSDWT